MQDLQATPEQQPVMSTEPTSEPLTPPDDTESVQLSPEEADEIFLNAVAEIPTQPLPHFPAREKALAERRFLIFVGIMVVSFLIGSIIGILTYPTVTVTLIPVQKSLQLTTTLAIPTRSLPPVTLTKSLSAPTTGHGYQDAKTATGTLTFYNGLFTPQTLPIGTVFTGSDGVKVATDASVTLPAGNPPMYGEATVTAQALTKGAAGNIQAGDIAATIANGVLVKGSAFSGGQDAREYPAVAQSDLARLTTQLKQQLTQQIPQAFTLRSGEALQTTHCLFTSSSNHQAGEEARTVMVKATQTCAALAYNQDNLERIATTAFTTTRPGMNYELVGSVQTSIISVFPFVVKGSGSWAYVFSTDYEQFLAQEIAGDTPAQAKVYLLQTGFVSQATVPQSLPEDPGHIHFQLLIGV